jgi:hypothetical protein
VDLRVDPSGSAEPSALIRRDVPGDLDTFARVGGLGLLDEAEHGEGEFRGRG